jgi:hypothetical protein
MAFIALRFFGRSLAMRLKPVGRTQPTGPADSTIYQRFKALSPGMGTLSDPINGKYDVRVTASVSKKLAGGHGAFLDNRVAYERRG